MNRIDQLKSSAERLIENRPAYRDILGFYGRVFEVQEESILEINLPPIIIEPELLAMKKENQMPLIDPSQFQIETGSAVQVLERICTLAQEYAPGLSPEAQQIDAAVKANRFEPGRLFSAILENNTADLEVLGKQIDAPMPTMILFGYLCMVPSIYVGSRQLETYLEKDAAHDQGYCPVCGHPPDLAVLDEEGRQHLKCCFCSHEWLSRRMGCVFCGNSDPDQQQYFYSNEEKEYRVNLCDHCGNYIKVVDLRQMTRFFHPGLELVSTRHLDLKAREKGYTNNLSF